MKANYKKLKWSKKFVKAHKYLEKHKEALREAYLYKNIIITPDGVMGAFEDFGEACDFADQYYKPGDFLIHFMEPADKEVKFIASAL